MAKTAFVGKLETRSEDGGRALIAELHRDDKPNGMFIRLQSWHENPESPGAHSEIWKFRGGRVLITIETID